MQFGQRGQDLPPSVDLRGLKSQCSSSRTPCVATPNLSDDAITFIKEIPAKHARQILLKIIALSNDLPAQRFPATEKFPRELLASRQRRISDNLPTSWRH